MATKFDLTTIDFTYRSGQDIYIVTWHHIGEVKKFDHFRIPEFRVFIQVNNQNPHPYCITTACVNRTQSLNYLKDYLKDNQLTHR